MEDSRKLKPGPDVLLLAFSSREALGTCIREYFALAGVAQWIECHPVNQRIASSIPSHGTGLGCWPVPQ